jgi:hypothetical protein
MSQDDDTLRRRLRQQLQTIRETDTGTEWLPELVEWLVQELLELNLHTYLDTTNHTFWLVFRGLCIWLTSAISQYPLIRSSHFSY